MSLTTSPLLPECNTVTKPVHLNEIQGDDDFMWSSTGQFHAQPLVTRSLHSFPFQGCDFFKNSFNIRYICYSFSLLLVISEEMVN